MEGEGNQCWRFRVIALCFVDWWASQAGVQHLRKGHNASSSRSATPKGYAQRSQSRSIAFPLFSQFWSLNFKIVFWRWFLNAVGEKWGWILCLEDFYTWWIVSFMLLEPTLLFWNSPLNFTIKPFHFDFFPLIIDHFDGLGTLYNLIFSLLACGTLSWQLGNLVLITFKWHKITKWKLKILHLNSKLHDEISISLYKSSSHGEDILFDHPLLVGLMQWNKLLLRPWKP